MPTVAMVRMRYSSQEYWFDPNESGVHDGDHVIVETVHGSEIGLCTLAAVDVDEADVTKPLKPIIRVATEEDLAKVDELASKGAEAMQSFRALVAKHHLDMKPVDVDFMFDGSHATFYFTAEERVDFRALVRDLASEFHVRVDMRQIGVRDEARMFGGLGHCGEELCCARMGGEFKPVTIRMAKEQDLPLNPSKISGLCGRLMCCLRYEFEAYKDFKSRAPKKGALIDTPLGMAKVVEFDTPRETVRVRFEDGKSVTLPVSAMDTGDKVAKNGENLRPCHISQEKFDEVIAQLHQDETLAMMGEKLFSDDPNLSDKTAEAGAIERNPQRKRRRGSQGSKGDAPTPRRKSPRQAKAEPPARDARKRRRSVAVSNAAKDGAGDEERRGTQGTGGESQQQKKSGSSRRRRRGSRGGANNRQNRQQDTSRAENASAAKEPKQRPASKPRPGQHSSGVSGDAAHVKDADSEQHRSKNGRRRRRRPSSANKTGKPQGPNTKAGE